MTQLHNSFENNIKALNFIKDPETEVADNISELIVKQLYNNDQGLIEEEILYINEPFMVLNDDKEKIMLLENELNQIQKEIAMVKSKNSNLVNKCIKKKEKKLKLKGEKDEEMKKFQQFREENRSEYESKLFERSRQIEILQAEKYELMEINKEKEEKINNYVNEIEQKNNTYIKMTEDNILRLEN